MLNKLLFLMTVVVSLVSADHKQETLLDFEKALQGFKGLMLGLQKGVYHDEFLRLEDDCLATDDTVEKIVFIHEFINGRRTILEAIPFVTTFADLVNNEFEFCGYTSTIEQIQEFCHGHGSVEGEPPCQMRQMVRAFYTRIFNVIGSQQRIMMTLSRFDLSDEHEIFLQAVSIGWEIGKIFRIILALDIDQKV